MIDLNIFDYFFAKLFLILRQIWNFRTFFFVWRITLNFGYRNIRKPRNISRNSIVIIILFSFFLIFLTFFRTFLAYITFSFVRHSISLKNLDFVNTFFLFLFFIKTLMRNWHFIICFSQNYWSLLNLFVFFNILWKWYIIEFPQSI